MEQLQHMQKLEQEEAERLSAEAREVSARRRKKLKYQRRQEKSNAREKPQRPSLATIKEKLQTQVEYYFSDFMLPHSDPYLAEAIAADTDGWVPLTTIMAYKRISELGQQTYDFGPAVVADALIRSPLLEMNRVLSLSLSLSRARSLTRSRSRSLALSGCCVQVRSAVRRRYPYGEQGADFVPLDVEEQRIWRTLCAFKTAPVHQGSDTNARPDRVGVVTVEMSFPPQTQEERAVVHRLAHILGLQHQSRGKGAKHAKQRYVMVRKRVAVTT